MEPASRSPQISPASLRTDLERILSDKIDNIWGDQIPDSFQVTVKGSDNLEFGDLSCQSALKLARIVHDNPRRIASMIVDSIEGQLPGISSVSVDGPGFINFTLSLPYLVSVSGMLASRGLKSLLPDIGNGKKALVEYVSSNPTGPLTVGHCRQAVLGESISSLLEATGWEVSREYYFNDTGRQMTLLGMSLAERYKAVDGGEAEIPEGGYHGDYITEWAHELRDEQGSDLSWENSSTEFITFARERAIGFIKSDLSLLNIEFDRYFAESELIPDAVRSTIEKLSSIEINGKSLVYSDNDEAEKLWLRFTSLGRPSDRVIVRDNGMYTYRLPDIAYHIDKFSRGYDLMIDVFGADHLDTSKDVTAALEILLGSAAVSDKLRIIIHQFVTLVREGRKIKMSTRAGKFVTLRELIRDVGSVDVTKYLFLTRRAEAHMDFDLDLARKESNENPVYYVQYAHARISGIMRTAKEAGIRLPEEHTVLSADLLDGEHERELMRLLELVPSRTVAAAEACEPHRLTEILADLATGFHRFYQHERIVDSDNPDASSARLTLCEACRRSISGLLEILGIDAPEKM